MLYFLIICMICGTSSLSTFASFSEGAFFFFLSWREGEQCGVFCHSFPPTRSPHRSASVLGARKLGALHRVVAQATGRNLRVDCQCRTFMDTSLPTLKVTAKKVKHLPLSLLLFLSPSLFLVCSFLSLYLSVSIYLAPALTYGCSLEQLGCRSWLSGASF